MSDVNISLLHRILPTYLEELSQTPEGAQLAAEIRAYQEMADGISGDAEENNVLSESEVEAHLETIIPDTQHQLSILQRNRESLVGELQRSQRRLRGRGGSEGLGQMIGQAAALDGNLEELSEQEVGAIEAQLQRLIDENTTENTLARARAIVSQMEHLRRVRPELFLSDLESAQQAAIPLDFLRFLSQEEWNYVGQVMRGVATQSINPNAQDLSEQQRAAIEILELVNIAGIEPWENPFGAGDEHYELTWERYQAFRNALPEEHQSSLRPAPQHFADLRARAYRLWEGRMAGLQPMEGHGVDVSPLARRGEELSDRREVQTLLAAAGQDQILTNWEAQLLMNRQQLLDGRNPDNPYNYMASAERLVGELGQFEFNTTDHEIPVEPGRARTQALNNATLRDLAYMINGYTDYDSYLIENSLFSNLTHLTTYVGTHLMPPIALLAYGIRKAADIEPEYRDTDILGGVLPVYNPTYMQYAREGVETNHQHRIQAAQYLSRLVGFNFSAQLENNQIPPLEARWAQDRLFMEWLETRPEGEQEPSIPNALEYMRTYRERWQAEVDRLMATGDYRTDVQAKGVLFSEGWDYPNEIERNYQILTGPLCRVDRLHELRSITDRDAAESAWMQFAGELEGRQWSFWGVHNTDGSGYFTDQPMGTAQWWYTRNPYFARTIYGALARQAGDGESRLAARQARQDSLGQDILDEDGYVEESPWYHSNQGGGSFGIVLPTRWFRNYSVENEDMSIENAITLIPVFRAGSLIARGIATARTSIPALGRGALAMLGVGTAESGSTASLGLARGAMSRWLQNLNRGLISRATREAGEAATQAAEREGAEALARTVTNQGSRPGFFTPLKEAWRQARSTGGVKSYASLAWHSVSYLWEGLKNVGRNLAHWGRTSSVGQSGPARWMGRKVSQVWNTNAFGLPSWLGGNLVRSGMNRVATWLEPIAAREGRDVLTRSARAAHTALTQASFSGLWQGIRSTVTWNNFFSLVPGYWYHRSRDAAPAVIPSYGSDATETEDGRLLEDRRFRLGLPREDSGAGTALPNLPTQGSGGSDLDAQASDDGDAGTELPEADMTFQLGE